MSKFYNIIYNLMIYNITLTIYSYSWLMMWLGMEINLMSIILMIFHKKKQLFKSISNKMLFNSITSINYNNFFNHYNWKILIINFKYKSHFLFNFTNIINNKISISPISFMIPSNNSSFNLNKLFNSSYMTKNCTIISINNNF